jgi:YspA, cpYpsA-related SLOG family
MTVIACGSYDLPTPAFVWRELDRLHAELGITALMQGGAAGVDRFARDWAAGIRRSNALSVRRSGTDMDRQQH